MFKQELYPFNGNSARLKTKFLWRFFSLQRKLSKQIPYAFLLHRLSIAVMRLFVGEPVLISNGKSMPMDAKSAAHTAHAATALCSSLLLFTPPYSLLRIISPLCSH